MYSNLFKCIPEAVLGLNFEGVIINASNKCLNLLGYNDLQMLKGKNFIDFFHKNDQSKISKIIEGKEEISSKVFKLLIKNENYLDLEITIGLLYDELLNPKSMIVVLHDISTYQKKIDHSHSMLDYIIKYNKSGIAIHDTSMNYLYVSNKYIEQYNLMKRDIIGKNHYEIFPDIPKRWKEVHNRALKGEVFCEERDQFIREDNTIDWTKWECRPWYNYDGSIGGIVVYTEVINTQVELEDNIVDKIKQIKNQKDRTETILNSIDESVISTDEKGKILFANIVACKFLNIDNKEIIGKNYADVINLYNVITKQRVPSTVETVLKTHVKSELSGPIVLITNDQKQHYVECKATPLRNTDGTFTGVVSFFKDITEQKLKEREIKYYIAHDSVTGLYNRGFMIEELMRLDQEQFYPIGLLKMDINGLKIINDAYGYEKGDEVIKSIAKILDKICANKFILGRVGGDEYSILITNCTSSLINEVKDLIKNEVSLYKLNNIELSLSYGYALRENRSTHITQFISEAENNMYKNKIIDGKSIRNNTIKAILETLTDKYKDELIHSQRVSFYCKKMGQALDLKADDVLELEIAGMFHDIGKISIPDAILDKPGSLTVSEYEIMKTHTTTGYHILKAADKYSNLAEYAVSHHERWDGGGYPNNLKEEEISLFSRIISIADAYEAMTTNRVYRTKISKEEAATEILKCAGKQFDPYLAKIFVSKVLNLKVDLE